MQRKILHYGLQRSGTNFLETVLLQNFNIKIINNNFERNHPTHKHFRLYDNKILIPESNYYNNFQLNNFNDFINSLSPDERPDGIIIISKDPYSWYLSYKSWAKKCNWIPPKHHYIEEYNQFYKKWIDFSKENDKVIFVNYINLLRNMDAEILDIKNKLHINKKFSLLNFFTSVR